jgi:uncharacterized repeat protein (TIGR04076 family)
MPGISKCKITVLKRSVNTDLAEEFLVDADNFSACDQFSDGQEFVVDVWYQLPEGFCPWAWADIRRDIKTIAVGGNPDWIKQPGTAIAGCTDWFRPVIFKIERIED